MSYHTEPVSERDGYTILEVSDIAADGSARVAWIEVVCPNGKHVLCDSVEAAEAFIDAKLSSAQSSPPPAT